MVLKLSIFFPFFKASGQTSIVIPGESVRNDSLSLLGQVFVLIADFFFLILTLSEKLALTFVKLNHFVRKSILFTFKLLLYFPLRPLLPPLEALALNLNVQFRVKSSHSVSCFSKSSDEKPNGIEACSFGSLILGKQEHAASAFMQVRFFHILDCFDVSVESLSEEANSDSFNNGFSSALFDSRAIHGVTPPGDCILQLPPLHSFEHFSHSSVLAAILDLYFSS